MWAANNTPISIEVVQLPFIVDGRCMWMTALILEDVEEVKLSCLGLTSSSSMGFQNEETDD